MSWNAAPILAVGAILTAGDWNSVAGDINILATYLPTFGTGAAMFGSAPTAGTPVLLLQGGYAASVTASAGAFTQALPTSYPNGTLVWVGNSAVANTDLIISHQSGTTASVLSGVIYRNLTALSGTFALSWIALGF